MGASKASGRKAVRVRVPLPVHTPEMSFLAGRVLAVQPIDLETRRLAVVLDLLAVPWRYSRANCVSIARRDAVQALDAFVGPKH